MKSLINLIWRESSVADSNRNQTASVQLARGPPRAAFNRMEFPMSITTKIAAFALTRSLPPARSLPRRIRPMQNRSALAGALEPASSAPPATTAITDTAIAAAAGFASSTLTAITWAASAPAITDDRHHRHAHDPAKCERSGDQIMRF
jgi:hypothetical protein